MYSFHFHWLSGVNDTAQFWLSNSGLRDLKIKNISEFVTSFKNILVCESVSWGDMFDGKKSYKSRETVPLSIENKCVWSKFVFFSFFCELFFQLQKLSEFHRFQHTFKYFVILVNYVMNISYFDRFFIAKWKDGLDNRARVRGLVDLNG